MPPQPVKILSWNVEKFSLINRLNETRSIPAIHSDLYLMFVLERTIYAVNPDIICFIELDVRTQNYVVNMLRSLLVVGEWEFRLSLPVLGGKPGAGGSRDNELFLVAFNKDKLALTKDPEIINSGSDPLLRGMFQCPFEFTDTKRPFTVWVAHLLEATKASGPPELTIVDTLAKGAPTDVPLFIIGDLNASYDEITRVFEPLDLLFQIKEATSKGFKFTMVTTQLSYPLPNGKLTNGLAYRNSAGTGVDDAIFLYDDPNKPDMGTAGVSVGNIPNSGIVDMLEVYKLELSGKVYPPNDDITHLVRYLNAIDPAELERSPSGLPQVLYGDYLVEVPEQKGEARNRALLRNAWARYIGGISDHLPIVMTIDIG